MTDTALPTPTLTLSLDKVDFCFHPITDESVVDFRQGQNNEILLNLKSFTGTLRVAMMPHKKAAVNESSVPQQATDATTTTQTESNDITPRTKHVSEVNSCGAIPDYVSRKHPAGTEIASEEAASSPFKKPRPSTAVEEELVDYSASQTTILGQPDFSQTQMSSTQEDTTSNQGGGDGGNSAKPSSMSQEREQPSRVQEIMMEDSNLSQDDADQSIKSRDASLQENTAVALPARVSLGGSPALATNNRGKTPCPRWGHAMTPIGDNCVLVYGGQTFDEKSGLPKTLKDIFVYDMQQETWFKPFNCEGMPRQWHTGTFLPERQLLISFGGEAANPKTGKVKTTDEVMVLDTEIMLWYPPTVSGDVPSGRSGHTATLLPKTNELVVFGGVKGSKWLNSVSVLDTMRWKWRTPKIQGDAPKPRSYHSATALGDNRVVVFGGNDATSSFATVHVLETASSEDGKWQWTHPKVVGYTPCNRTGHSAILLADKKTICIYGGWDPNSEDESSSDNDESTIFQDSFLLDTEKWVWKKGPVASHVGDQEDGGPKRVGHTAILNTKGSEILIFGGRLPGDRFTGDFQSLAISGNR